MIKIVIVIALAVAGFVSGAGEKSIVNREGNCRLSVPANWDVSQLSGLASAPDKSFSVAMSSPRIVESFAQLKENARKIYKDSKVTKDSGSEYELEGKSMGGKPNVYRAIPTASNRFCIVEVTYQGSGAGEARRIAGTLKGAK